MSWLSCLPWSEGIKKRACRYLLQRYLGQFLEEKLTLDQLTVDLYNGTGCVTNVSLDVQALNELGEQNNLPLEFVDGFISEISVSIPWSALLSDASYVQVKGLKITVQPRQRAETGTSMFESMWSSMTSSMQLAQECLQQDANNTGNSQPLEGVELFAQTIDSILCRVKVRFIDTVIRLEHVPLDSATGVAVEMFIKNLEYSDEAGSDPNNINLDSNQPPSKGYIVSAFTTKRFYLEGISFYTDEFPSRARTFSRSVITNSQSSTPDSKNSDGHFSSAQISPIQNKPSPPPDKNLINQPSESNPIMWAKLTGRQELRLKIKQGEGILGPKVELEITFGSFISFLSPRQLHVLIELSRGLASPDLEDISNVAPRQTCTEKPMAGSDFSRVERELMHQLHPIHGNIRTNDLRHTQGWSTGSVDESDNEDEFLPMKLPGAMSDSTTTTATNNMDNSCISASSMSSKSSVNNLSKPHKRRPSADTDPTAETTQFHIRLSSIAIVLLHDDILTIAVENQGLTNASTKQMKSIAEDFFSKLGIFAADGYGNKNFDNASKIFIEACQLSHIRLLAAPLMIEGSEKTTPQASSINGTLTLATVELVECLIDNSKSKSNSNSNRSNDDKLNYECIELLTFPKTKVDTFGFSSTTDFLMRFKYSEKAVRHGQITKYAHPRTEINIQIESFKSELDITIVDRISSVLNPQLICTYNTTKTIHDMWNQQNVFYQAVDNPILSDSRIDFKITSPNVTLKVRFPIPDLRPLHDMNRAPWWTRSVRPDYITLTLTDVQINTSIDSRTHYLTRHEIQCKRLFLTYTEIDSDIPIEIGRSQVDEKPDSSLAQDNNEGFGWPRIALTIYPRHFGRTLEDSSEEEPHSSLDESLGQTPRHQPSPFSSKRVIHESDTPHSESQTYSNNKEDKDNEHREGEELIIPGNRSEMLEFIEEGSRDTRIQIEVNLPCLSVQIPSKHIYEQLYNRINTDFLLWEPSAPKLNYTPTDNHVRLDLASTLLQESIYPKFSMCKSGIKYDSDSDTDDDEVFKSTTAGGKNFHQMSLNKLPKNGQSKLSLSINISQGILSLNTPVRDNLSNVIPGQQGEMIFRVEDATIFCVSSYKGNVNLGYVCMMVKNVSLNHCGLLTIPSSPAPLRSINSINPRHCQPTIYRSENGIKDVNTNNSYSNSNNSNSNNENDMLSVAIRIQSAHQTHHIKTFRVAVGIRNATLRHRMTSSQTSWFTQLTDCLDVIDHPVAGYSPPGVLTELYLHLWNCAIDYRPIYLPLRSLVTLGNFSISSNIAAKTNTSTLRFIAEDVALFLSEKLGNHIDLKRDYVCVMDLGLFELSLRLNEKMFGGAPRVDLRASNNVLHLRTCSDSGRALMQLLTYFASDGDMSLNTGSTESIAVPSSGDEESLLGDESINTLSKSQEERVNSLMEEAMEDTVKGKITSDKKSPEDKTQVEVFFFPDESHPTVVPSSSAKVTATKTKSQFNLLNSNSNVNVVDGPTAATRGGNESDDTDEDFCILGEEAGTGIMPRHGVPEVRWLSQEYLRIVDNHFSIPLGKIDLLKAPKNFPPPILRYTLCEMTLIWHMYGGKDFGNTKSSNKKNVSIDDNNSLYGLSQGRSKSDIVGFSKISPNEIRFGSCPNSPRDKIKTKTTTNISDWYTKGGPGRQSDILMELQLNKVRFQHETYPENSSEASRQVLLISEIEIRDRLASSHINKFLYQYSSEAKPRQTHANMFAMKAVHIRPDPKFSAQECCLKLSLLPLRLNIDQDSLLFLIDFFTELTGNIKSNQDNINGSNSIQSTPNSKQGTPTHHPPVMSVNDTTASSTPSQLSNTDSPIKTINNDIVDQNLMILLEDELTIKENKTKTKINIGPQDDSQPVYFRSVVFSPEVLIRLDYQGKRVDLTHGPMAGLLMGLAQLNCSELRLKRLTHRHGLLGFDKLIAYMLTEWLQDIKKNQLPSLLGGVGPMHSLVQLFQGFRDLFWLPIEQYQKDGRIVRGLQRGANSFTTSTALAALELTSRLVNVIQSTAETAYDMVSPGPSVRRKSKRGQKGRPKRYSQPLDIREGVANAYMLVKEGLGETANQLVRVASEEHEQKGVSGAVGGVLRQIPPTVVKPIILATEATNNVLGGMRSQLVPDARREAAQKWRQEIHDN